ncbi:hypothetical protein [Roseovarius sp. ZX-A-9]|uniref:hypothetical protein n=1 Tax=Roseovarius sp. ZX-A-9 TaxID=3014783 RepID=UPI0023307775|nr:hypothetical protein [Roseovarius sp. ZX-A-9]
MTPLTSDFDRPHTLHDVLTWATDNAEPYAAICELRKIPARLGMIDDDIGLIPADLGHFESHIAPSAYGVVSKSRDLKSARQRGNARARALLKRFHESIVLMPKDGRTEWSKLVDFVQNREGFVDRGALFTTGKSRGLMMLRARFRVPPNALTTVEIERVAADLNSEKRKAFGRALKTLNSLIAEFSDDPEIDGLLPSKPVSLPRPVLGRERILWTDLPEAFRSDAEAVIQRALARPEDRMTEARQRIEAGEDAAVVLRDLDEAAAGRQRAPRNPESAMVGWRGAITWLVLAAERRGHRRDLLESLVALFTSEILESACTDQINRSTVSDRLKDPAKSQTLKSRLTALETLAKHGLKRPDLVAIVELQKRFHQDYIRNAGKSMTDDARQLCDALIRKPSLAGNFVNAPKTIASRAIGWITNGQTEGNPQKELSGLRLYAAAVLFAVQVSRPVRSSNLIGLRYRSTQDEPGHITWVKKKFHAELRFPAGEIKNDREVSVHLYGDEAHILWTWIYELRPRYLKMRDLTDTTYVIPGAANPRLIKSGMHLPPGCIAPSTLSELWRGGTDIIGLDMTPHQCRHAVATLILAVEPGNFSKAAAVLGDTEDTVRRHYGRDNGAEAAKQVRAALKSQHPDIFTKMKRRVA